MLEKTRNQPLAINIHIIDNATDKEERTVTYHLSKPPSRNQEVLSEKEKREIVAVDKKIKAIMNLVIWAMNNNKTLEMVNKNDDD